MFAWKIGTQRSGSWHGCHFVAAVNTKTKSKLWVHNNQFQKKSPTTVAGPMSDDTGVECQFSMTLLAEFRCTFYFFD